MYALHYLKLLCFHLFPERPDKMTRVPWGSLHFRGQDVVAMAVGSDVHIVDPTSMLLLQKISYVSPTKYQTNPAP